MLPQAKAGTCKSAGRDGTRSHDKQVHRKVMDLGHELVDHVLGLYFLVGRDLGPTDNTFDIGAGGKCRRRRSGYGSLAQDARWT